MRLATIVRAATVYSSLANNVPLACKRAQASSKAPVGVLTASGSKTPSAYCLMKPWMARPRPCPYPITRGTRFAKDIKRGLPLTFKGDRWGGLKISSHAARNHSSNG